MPPELSQWTTPSLGGLLAAGVMALLTGLLVPLRTVRRELAAAEQRADDFKAAWQAADARADKLLEQQEQLLSYAKTADAALTALRRAAEQQRGGRR